MMSPPESDKVQVRIRNKVGGQNNQIGSILTPWMSNSARNRRRRTSNRQRSASRFSSSWSSIAKRRSSKKCSYLSSREYKSGRKSIRLFRQIGRSRPILKSRNKRWRSTTNRNCRRLRSKGKKKPRRRRRNGRTRSGSRRSRRRRKSKSKPTSSKNSKPKK